MTCVPPPRRANLNEMLVPDTDHAARGAYPHGHDRPFQFANRRSTGHTISDSGTVSGGNAWPYGHGHRCRARTLGHHDGGRRSNRVYGLLAAWLSRRASHTLLHGCSQGRVAPIDTLDNGLKPTRISTSGLAQICALWETEGARSRIVFTRAHWT